MTTGITLGREELRSLALPHDERLSIQSELVNARRMLTTASELSDPRTYNSRAHIWSYSTLATSLQVLKIADIRYAKFFLATSEYRQVARSIFQNVAPKFFSLVCNDSETTDALLEGGMAINQQVSATNEKTDGEIVRIIEVARFWAVRGVERLRSSGNDQ